MDKVIADIRLKSVIEDNAVTVMRQSLVSASLGFAILAFLGKHVSAGSSKVIFIGPVVLLIVACVLAVSGSVNFRRRVKEANIDDAAVLSYQLCFWGTSISMIFTIIIGFHRYLNTGDLKLF